MKTDYLTFAQLHDITGQDNREGIRVWFIKWNETHNDEPVNVTKPKHSGQYQVHASTLPDELYSRLEELESFGVKYYGDINGHANAYLPEYAELRKRAREYWHDQTGYDTRVSFEVSHDIGRFIEQLIVQTPADINGEPCEQCKSGDYCEYDCNAMQLTVACDETGTQWNYQTGDNSYTGGAYGLPHWSVVSISHDSDRATLAAAIIEELKGMVYDASA